MKKELLFAAFATVLLAGCSNEVSESYFTPSDRTPITVQTYTPGVTRVAGTEATDAAIKGTGFYLLAEDLAKEQYIVNTAFKYDAQMQVWGNVDDATFYWPDNANTQVEFTALYDPNATYAANPVCPITTDGIAITNVGESDYMVDNFTTTLADHPAGGVTIGFKHIMAAVKVVSIALEDGYDMKVGPVSIKEVPTSATYFVSDNAFQPGTVKSDSLQINNSSVAAAKGTFNNPYLLNTTSFSDVSNQVFLIPGVEYTLSFNYTISFAGESASEIVTKTAKFTPVAGRLNTLKVSLSAGKVQISINVSSIPGWETQDDQGNPYEEDVELQ